MKKQQHDISSSSLGSADAATDVQIRLRRLPTFARELIAGGLAGGLAKTAVAPLERTKIIFQTRGGQLTVQGVLQYIWQQEGFVGLFKGNTASVLRIVPYAAIHFGLYEYYRRGIVQLAIPNSKPGSKEQATPLWDLLAGSASGASAVLATYPLDLIRTRLAYGTEAPPAPTQPGAARTRHRHPGIFALLASTARDEGLLGLYRGVLPTLLGILPYAGLKFYVYQTMKNHYRAGSFGGSSSSSSSVGQAASQADRQQQQQLAAEAGNSSSTGSSDVAVEQAADCVLAPTAANTLLGTSGNQQQQAWQQQQQQQQPPDGNLQQQQPQKLPVLATLLFGGVAGLVAQTVTYPLDVIRRQLQVAHLNRSATIKELNQLSSSSSIPSNTNQRFNAAGPAGSSSSSSTSAGLLSVQKQIHSAAADSSNSSSSSWQRSPDVTAATPGAGASHSAAAGSSSSSSSSSSRPAASGGCRQPSHAAQHGTLHGSMQNMHSTRGVLHPEPSMVAVTRNLLAQGGMRALFRGLSINYMKVVPSTAIGFTVYDALKSYLGLTNSL